ncbi:acyl-CoA carboxylase epsilon subunit [Streptacidiphilus jiangxiensis]|uniref:Acyl-CoA carboxylase epsilon subunit n=1 Tax=Streptacidiphilus jiangxiensis TaxID=235985 RepID=A0A1H7MHA1_STRJI|nr:acyl-CoA carboxylase epsilon subunit [Streptacidiphilus jiangxiensis]SEL10075.1 Acyl-CoA carboxylase epsilon subunit [Streptacidiphilus jiangxiensis]
MAPIRVLHGQPNPEELAAVLAVVSARAAAGAAAAPEAPGANVWRSRAALVRRMPQPGPNAWRTSAWAGR